MSIFRYYLMLFIGVFILISFFILIGSLFVALLPIIIPVTVILILFALFSGRKRTVVFRGTEEPQPPPPASEDTIDITAVEVNEQK